MSEQTSPPAGWYPDPQNPIQPRYWDGAAWTQHVAPAMPASTAPGGYTGPPPKKRLSTGAIVGIVAGGLLTLGLIAAVVVGMLTAVAVPVYENQETKAHDSNARRDASRLGLEMAVYFVDQLPPPPRIEVVDGSYVFVHESPGSYLGAVSEGVEFGGQSGSTSTDWCVWVTAPQGEVKDFKHSAQHGNEQGRC